ncbi:13314_t:CDS:10 [Ambispora leptoticha]|uniref:13314_t:CDS:1 n=1 Tax=Ambispora leptoticha TaxID=144679 RepID=A0A9N9AQJ9_9GLOM|nr:13314_t:CDS:10 [Ambispora leptoticha]
MADKKKRLVFSIIQFLESSIKDGTIKPDDAEGIEVAVQCIGEAFGVNPQDPEQIALYSTKHNLPLIFNMAIQAEEKLSAKASKHIFLKNDNTSKKKKPVELTQEQKQKAEELKSAGNKKVSEKNYDEAVKFYSEAISIDCNNAVFYANRAAAYSQMGQHDKAIEDATKSTQVDPSYSKAYSRLGHAYYSIGKYQEAVDAYEKGLSLDPNNSILKSALGTAEQKVNEIKSGPRSSTDGGLPGLGRGSGGLDFSTLMNNPQLMNMASQMMQSGAFNDLLNNPNIAEMANNMMRGGAPPNMDEMMNNPEIANLARQFGNMPGGNNTGDSNGSKDDNSRKSS